MKKKLVLLETEDQGYSLFLFDGDLGFSFVESAPYGVEYQNCCFLGKSEKKFRIFFLNAAEEICRLDENFEKAEDCAPADKGLFFKMNHRWYWQGFNEKEKLMLGEYLIGKSFYWYSQNDGQVRFIFFEEGLPQFKIYQWARGDFGTFNNDEEEKFVFLKRQSGSYDIINNRGEWVTKTVVREEVAVDGIISKRRFFTRHADGAYQDRGIYSTIHNWDNSFLELNEAAKKVRLYEIGADGIKLIQEGTKRSFEDHRDYLGRVEKFWLNGYLYHTFYRGDPRIEDVDFSPLKTRWWRKLKDFFTDEEPKK